MSKPKTQTDLVNTAAGETVAVAPMAHFRLGQGETATYVHHNAILEHVEATRKRLGLGPSGLAKLEEGEAFLGARYNVLAAEIDAIENLRVESDRSQPAPPFRRLGPELLIKLTESNGNGAYAWRQQLGGPPHEWVDGPAHGTFESWPACEVNGNARIKAGTIASANLSPSSQTLLFQTEGSPS